MECFPWGRKKFLRGHVIFPRPPSVRQMFHAWILALAGYKVGFYGMQLWPEKLVRENVTVVMEDISSYSEVVEEMKDELAGGLALELGYRGALFVVRLRRFAVERLGDAGKTDELLEYVFRGCLLSHADMKYVAQQWHSLLFAAVEEGTSRLLENHARAVKDLEKELEQYLFFRKFRTGGRFVIVTREKVKDPSLYIFHRYPDVEAVYWFSKNAGKPDMAVRRDRSVRVRDDELAYIKQRLALPVERRKLTTGGVT